MPRAIFLAGWLAFAALAAEVKPPPTVEQSDELLRIVATLYLDKDAVVRVLGLDPGLPMIVVEVKFSPRGENKVPLWLDDFTLLSHKDGQRSAPLTPTQIAGRGGIAVTTGAYQRRSTGATIGLGPIGIGKPHDTPTPGTTPATEIAVTGSEKDENPLLAALKEKVVPEREVNEDTTGLLYFLLDGKLKPKDLELIWKSTGRKLMMEFGQAGKEK